MTNIDREVAANVLHHFTGTEGFSGGGFCEALLGAASKADAWNLNKLARAFPEKIAAFRLAKEHPDGLDLLRAAFAGESST